MNIELRPSVQRAALLLLVILGFALRVGGLGVQELRGDEAFGYFFQQRSWQAIVDDTIALDEPHPVASYFAQKAWVGVAGSSEFALRFTSAWWSTLAVALILRPARRLGMSRNSQLLALLLMAVSPYAIWHAQDARMYGMSLALNLAVVWLALEALARRRLPWVAGYVTVTWLALHTHYFSAFVLLGLSLFVVGRAVVHAPARRALFDWLVWNLILIGLMLPWLTMAGATVSSYRGNGDSPGLMPMLVRALNVMAVGETVPAWQRLLWAVVFGGLLLVGGARLWWSGSNSRRSLWLLVCVGLAPILLTWFSAWNRPIFNERYLIAALPGMILLAASVLEPGDLPLSASQRSGLRWTTGALLLLLVAGMTGSLVRYRNDEAYSKDRGWRELSAAMAGLGVHMPAGTVHYAQNYPDPTLWYYAGPVPHSVLPPTALDGAAALREVTALGEAGVQRIVLAQQPNAAWDPGTVAAQALTQGGYTLAASLPVANWSVQVWESPLPALTARDDRFARGLSLRGVTVRPETPAPGGLLNVMLAWQAGPGGEPLSGTEAVSVQVLSDSGAVLAQNDQPLPPTLAAGASAGETSAATQHGILLPQALPVGDLRMILVVYDPAAPGAPRLPAAGGADAVELARWQLAPPALP